MIHTCISRSCVLSSWFPQITHLSICFEILLHDICAIEQIILYWENYLLVKFKTRWSTFFQKNRFFINFYFSLFIFLIMNKIHIHICTFLITISRVSIILCNPGWWKVFSFTIYFWLWLMDQHTYFYVSYICTSYQSYGRKIVDYQVLLMNSFIVSETD